MGTLGLKLTRTKYRDVTCGQCSRVFITKEPRKLFCDPCGISRRTKRAEREERLKGPARWISLQKINREKAAQGPWLHEVFERPQPRWVVITSFPFSMDVSKNRRWSNNGRGAVFLSNGVRQFQQRLIDHLREVLAGQKIKTAKVWIGIHVQKPNHKCDAVNAVDTICDALKKAIGIDDNWFCIDMVDWSVQKHDPRIFIRISQEATCDMTVCSHCGDIAPASTYSKRKGGPSGHARVCTACQKAMNAERKVLRREAPEGVRVTVQGVA